jgi:hypothetical protein
MGRHVGVVLLLCLTVGVGVISRLPDGDAAYEPPLDQARFTSRIDNPYLPIAPGTRWVYEGPTDEGFERKVVEVTTGTRVVMGVNCVVVRDTVTHDGKLSEDTVDWYAQDADGNVWNFGEETSKADGPSFTPAGSWEAGVGTARPGVVMWAHPQPGAPYRQEYLPGEAEDMAEVLQTAARVTVPFGVFGNVVVTKDWSPLDGGAVDHKSYAAGIGMIREEAVQGESSRIDLVEMTRPGSAE